MGVRDQAGVIPFRRTREGLEICLIRTRGRKKWKIPKGFVDPGETVRQAALKEAWEEAGLRGNLVGDPIGSYEYEKWNLHLTVAVFLMEVTAAEDEWDESRLRERNWMLLEDAIEKLRDHPVRELLADVAPKLERRKRSR